MVRVGNRADLRGGADRPVDVLSRKLRPPSARECSDEKLAIEIRRVHEQKYGVYGAIKVWHALRRERNKLGRDQVARIMRAPADL